VHCERLIIHNAGHACIKSHWLKLSIIVKITAHYSLQHYQSIRMPISWSQYIITNSSSVYILTANMSK